MIFFPGQDYFLYCLVLDAAYFAVFIIRDYLVNVLTKWFVYCLKDSHIFYFLK